jgi:hypothetical protein
MKYNFFFFTIKFELMVRKYSFLIVLAIVSITILWSSCKTSKSSGPVYVGKWKYEVPDMPGNNTGTLVISKEGDNYSCVAVTDFGDQPIDSFDIQDGKLIASFTDAGGTLVEFDGVFDGNTLTGKISAQGMSLDYSAMKIE